MATGRLFPPNPAKAGGNVPALSRGPWAARGGKLPALGYRAPQIEGGSGATVTLYPTGPLSIGLPGEGGGSIPFPFNPGIGIGGSQPRIIAGRRPNAILQRARQMQAQSMVPAHMAASTPVPVSTRGAGRPPQNANYKIFTVPVEVTNPAIETTARPVPVAPSPPPPIAGPMQALPAGTGGAIAQRGLLANAINKLGLLEAVEAAGKLLTGQQLSGPEFGALAGAILGAFEGDPAAGAKVGATVGTEMAALNSLSIAWTGQGIDHWLTSGAKALWGSLAGQGGASPQLPPPPVRTPLRQLPEPETPPPGYHQCRTDLECETYGKWAPDGNQIQQQYDKPLTLPVPQPTPTPFKPPLLPSQYRPPTLPPPEPCPTCTQGLQHGDDCPPEVQQLVQQIANCPPQLLQKVFDRLQIRQPSNGKPAQIIVAEPVCLCCDSENDLDAYMRTGGVQGNCTQVLGASVDDVRKQ